MNSYVFGFQEIDKTKRMVVEGKGLHLGELSRVEGLRVPEGFCVTTEAFKEFVQKGCIREKEDIYYLSFEELREVVRTNKLDSSIITRRREEHEVHEKLTPPRVMTSEGEIISGESLGGKIPRDALAGIPVSAGIIEGRARVILKIEDAAIEDGMC